MKNKGLINAKNVKQDEFYTQLSDIEKELKYYKKQFNNKIIYCNCDDPYESNFFKYFAANFNELKLKKLIATSYKNSPIADKKLGLFDFGDSPEEKIIPVFKIEINEMKDYNNDGAINLDDVEYLLKNNKDIAIPLKGDGDFRSKECIKLLEESDIVVTNPPFSLFREYVAQLMEYNKKFLIIGNVNAITYKEIFKYIKEDKMWLGVSIHSGDREFRVPDDYPLNAAGYRVDENNNKYIRVKGVRWFTNLDVSKRHDLLILYKHYNSKEYPKYDNYDAIEVSKVADIPMDYEGVMGVPITFLDKHCVNQFEILAKTNNKEHAGEYLIGENPTAMLNGKNLYHRILIRRKQ